MIGSRRYGPTHHWEAKGKGGWSVAYIVSDRGLGERVKGGE